MLPGQDRSAGHSSTAQPVLALQVTAPSALNALTRNLRRCVNADTSHPEVCAVRPQITEQALKRAYLPDVLPAGSESKPQRSPRDTEVTGERGRCQAEPCYSHVNYPPGRQCHFPVASWPRQATPAGTLHGAGLNGVKNKTALHSESAATATRASRRHSESSSQQPLR